MPGLTWTDRKAKDPVGMDRRFAALLVLAVVAALLPLALTVAPPILDYPNHLARGVILAGQAAPEVARHYTVSWTNVPNLSADLLLVALLQPFAPEDAGRVLLAMVVLVQFAGILVYARVAFERWTLWSIAGITAIFSGPFFFGFINYGLAVGLALLLAAAWRSPGRRHTLVASLLLAAGMAALWFTHLDGVLFAGILIISDEILKLLEGPRAPSALVRRSLVAVRPYLIPLALLAALYAVSPIAGASSPPVWDWGSKSRIVAFVTGGPDLRVEIAVALVLLAILVAALIRGTLEADRASVLAAALCAMLFVASPTGVKSVWYVDSRFAAMASMLAFASLAPRFGSTGGRIAILAAGAAIAVRLAVISAAWTTSAPEIADVRQVMACLPPGARLVVTDTQNERDLPRHRRIAFERTSAYNHIGAWAVTDRGAFWPFLFAYAGQQPIIGDPAYEHLLHSFWTLKAEDYLRPRAGGGADLAPATADFDFLIAIGAGKDAVVLPEGASDVATSGFARLVKLRPGAPEAACP